MSIEIGAIVIACHATGISWMIEEGRLQGIEYTHEKIFKVLVTRRNQDGSECYELVDAVEIFEGVDRTTQAMEYIVKRIAANESTEKKCQEIKG